MNNDPRSSASEELPEAFVESLESYVFGVISIEQIRKRIAALLNENQDWGPDMLIAIDNAYNNGHLNGTAYRTLITEIDLGTSEDEPTEWSEKTRAEFGEEADPPVLTQTVAPDAEPAEPEPIVVRAGAVLNNRYVLQEKIGTGSMGDVYRAVDRKAEADGAAEPTIAIKIVSREFSSSPSALDALKQEAAHGERLVHPNIIRVFDFDWDGDQFFMTMEWLQGESLVDILNGRRFQPMPADQANAIVAGLCHGLAHAHAQGIVHSDVKPGNVFVTRAGHTKLLDFGIARVAAEIPVDFDATGIGAHTPAYSSCEVLEGEVPAPLDDVYSLGCLTYRLLAGRRAFGGAIALDAEAKNLELQPIPGLDEARWTALKGALAWRRIHRTPDVATFLAEYSSQATVDMTRPMPKRPVAEPEDAQVGRPGIPLKFGLPALAAILAAIAVVLWRPSPAPIAPAPIAPAPIVTTPAEPIETKAPAEPVETETPAVVDDNPAEPIEPVPEDPDAEQFEALLDAANQRMDSGQLLEPADDSARYFVAELEAMSPDSPELQQTRLRLANLMLLEAMVAINDEKFPTAEDWISETRTLGVPDEMTARYESELVEARKAKAARDAETLGAIFASATPAAILANPDVTFELDEQATALAMVLPGEVETPAGETAATPMVGPEPEPEPELTPLSVLEFRRFVEPVPPAAMTQRNVQGWVEVNFDVDEKGRTTNVRVIDAEPAGVFDEAALSAVRRWRFHPHRQNGRVTATESGVRLLFQNEE